MNLEYKLITDKDTLLGYKKEIFELFEHCFHRKMLNELWEWQYLKNPVGNSLVSLCFDGNTLVGHYATIQLPIIVNDHSEKALLSVGSMVHNSYRKYGIFIYQGEHLYSSVKNEFFCVIGFPNKMALPARKKRLAWTIDERDYVALVTKKQLIEAVDYNEFLHSKKNISLNIQNNDFMQWRLSKPSIRYEKHNSVIIKKFEDNQDIVYLQKGYGEHLKDDCQYYVLCDGTIESLKQYKAFDYPFGYRIFNGDEKAYTFKKDLLMSDVF